MTFNPDLVRSTFSGSAKIKPAERQALILSLMKTRRTRALRYTDKWENKGILDEYLRLLKDAGGTERTFKNDVQALVNSGDFLEYDVRTGRWAGKSYVLVGKKSAKKGKNK